MRCSRATKLTKEDQSDGCRPQPARSVLLGVRMSQKRIVEMKVEAARRGISVADLFEDIWTAYVANRIKR